MKLDKDPLDVALDIKLHFARTVASRDRPAKIDRGYVLGAGLWWLVIFGGLSIAGTDWLIAAVLALVLCAFWPLVVRS